MAGTGLGWLLAAASLIAFIATVAGDPAPVNWTYPVRTAEDEITSLTSLEFKPNFKQYSGYLEADESSPRRKFFHYWLVESQSNPDKDPLVLWLNGGPGCSSMQGVLTESGPYRLHENGSVLKNPYSLNRKLNVLYLEGPAGVGFSYDANDKRDITVSDDMMAWQYLRSLRSFFKKFPKLSSGPCGTSASLTAPLT